MPREPLVNVPDRTPEIFDRIKRERKKMALPIVILIVLNIILFLFVVNGTHHLMDGFWNIACALVFGVTVLGFALGLLATFFLPYARLTYTYKYVWASLICILTLHSLLALSLIGVGLLSLL